MHYLSLDRQSSEFGRLFGAHVQYCFSFAFHLTLCIFVVTIRLIPASQHRLMGLIGEETAVAAASTPWSHGGVFAFVMLVE